MKVVCDVTANPLARVSWVKNGQEINNTFTSAPDSSRRDVTISTSEIKTSQKTPSGLYQIEATNSAGSSTAEVEINVIGIS